MSEDCFSVDICLDETWLLAALENVRKGGICRVTTVIMNSGPNTKYKSSCIGGGDTEFLRVTAPGDITKEPWYSGKLN